MAQEEGRRQIKNPLQESRCTVSGKPGDLESSFSGVYYNSHEQWKEHDIRGRDPGSKADSET